MSRRARIVRTRRKRRGESAVLKHGASARRAHKRIAGRSGHIEEVRKKSRREPGGAA